MKKISNVTQDFDELYNELARRLAAKETWADLLPTNMGSTVMDMFAGAGVTNQYNIELALRESFLLTARRESSVLAGTRWLGVRISRKVSGVVPVMLTNGTQNTAFIAPYSKFIIGESIYYNDRQFVIAPGQTHTGITLYEGEPKKLEIDLDTISDLSLYALAIPEPGFKVADKDLLVYTRDKDTNFVQEWVPTENALWEHSASERVYFENTDEQGQPFFIFGDGRNGQLLPANHTLHVRYVISSGSLSNNNTSGIPVVYTATPEISGMTEDAVRHGANEKPANYYKQFAPHLYRSKRRFVTQSEKKAGVISFPGVADAEVLGQRDIAPNDPSWMNVVRICVLPVSSDTLGGANPNPQSLAWTRFLEWFEQHIGHLTVQTWNPEKILTAIQIKVAADNTATDYELLKTQVIEAILGLFVRKPGILGRKLAISDIAETVTAVPGVDYVEVLKPEKSILPSSKLEYVALQGIPEVEIFRSERVKK